MIKERLQMKKTIKIRMLQCFAKIMLIFFWIGFLTAVPVTVSADTLPSDGFYSISVKLGDAEKTLDISGGSHSNGGNVQIWNSNGTPAQMFYLENAGDGFYHIKNAGSGLLLDVSGGSSANGANVQQYEANGTDAQLWRIEDDGDGSYTITSKISDKALDVSGARSANGTNVQIYESNGTDAQRWYLTSPASPENGKIVTLFSVKDSSLVIDVSGGATTGGARLTLQKMSGSESQKFLLKENDDGSFTLENEKSELAVDVSGGSFSNGAALQIYNPNGSGAQKWQFRPESDGSFALVNSSSGKAVDIPGGIAKSGAMLQMYDQNDTEAQRFYLVLTEAEAHEYDGIYTLSSALTGLASMDVSGASLNDCANIQLYPANLSNAQKFRFIYSGDGFYRILNINSGKAVDISGGYAGDGGNIQQYSYNGTDAQLFRISGNDDGTITLFNKNGKAVEAAGNSSASGTNIQTYTYNGSQGQKWYLENEAERASRLQQITDVRTSDAKFFRNGIITSINNEMTYIDFSTDSRKDLGIKSSWLCGVEEDGIILYGNFSHEVGIVRVDENMDVAESHVLIDEKAQGDLMIDPTILKTGDGYYFTVTNIHGRINNENPNLDNGHYTVSLYHTVDFSEFEDVSTIVEDDKNLEDVDLCENDGSLIVTFEREILDKGKSSVEAVISADGGATWSAPAVLLAADADHEPASFYKTDAGWRLYYSSDIENPGTSYSGAKAFAADYDDNFNPVSVNQPVLLSEEGKVLLYDIKNTDGSIEYLYAYDYIVKNRLTVDLS